MIHARDDYNRIQDPAVDDPSLLSPGSTPIGREEPVFLLRAQDKHFLAAVLFYRRLVLRDPATTDRRMVDALDTLIGHAATWQREHGAKTPDL